MLKIEMSAPKLKDKVLELTNGNLYKIADK